VLGVLISLRHVAEVRSGWRALRQAWGGGGESKSLGLRPWLVLNYRSNRVTEARQGLCCPYCKTMEGWKVPTSKTQRRKRGLTAFKVSGANQVLSCHTDAVKFL
jgi:hypothetical protein